MLSIQKLITFWTGPLTAFLTFSMSLSLKTMMLLYLFFLLFPFLFSFLLFLSPPPTSHITFFPHQITMLINHLPFPTLSFFQRLSLFHLFLKIPSLKIILSFKISYYLKTSYLKILYFF